MSTLRRPQNVLQIARQAARRPPTLGRAVHQRVPLPYDVEQGLQQFMSPQTLRTVAVDWQQGVLTRLNELVRGTELESVSVLQTVKSSATDPSKALVFNYASEALNNSFFLSTLTPTPSAPTPNSAFSQALVSSRLQSFSGLVSHFSAHVAGLHPSSGAYVWLVTDQAGNLGVIGTYAGGTPLVYQQRQVAGAPTVLGELIPEAGSQNEGDATAPGWQQVTGRQTQRSKSSTLLDSPSDSLYKPQSVSQERIGQQIHPLACVSVHPHCYLADYGVWGREEYVKNWWSAVDWKKVEDSFVGFISSSS